MSDPHAFPDPRASDVAASDDAPPAGPPSSPATEDADPDLFGVVDLDAPQGLFARHGGILVGVAVMLATGALPALLGYGPFGIRLFTSTRVEVFVLNLSGADVEVALPFHARTPVQAGTLGTLDTMSGTIEITTWNDAGDEIDRFTVEADRPLLYDVGATRCFAVFDVTGFYGGGGEPIRFLEYVERQKTWVFTADTVILPRRTPPDVAVGTVHWIEPVECGTVRDGATDELLMWAEYRLRQRRERFEENRRRGP